MKILVCCLNVNGFGGSEMYHYELVRELHSLGNNVTLFSLRDIDKNDSVRKRIDELGIRQIDAKTLDINEKFDIILASQPQVNAFIIQYFKGTPLISVIHSEIRSETPILDENIYHYISIRKPITDMLINEYGIPNNKISLIYNPIDQSRFNSEGVIKNKKTSGIFVGEVLDPIRFKAVSHLVDSCIENDWDLYLMSNSKHDFNHSNIKYINTRWDTENVVKHMDFTAGILLGRTTLEGWCCDVPGYVYLIDVNGNLTEIETTLPDNIKEMCNSRYVANQHIELYKNIIK